MDLFKGIEKEKIRYIYNMEMINIFILIWVILIIYILYQQIEKSNVIKEGFTPKIRSFYHPHLRNLRITMESFMNNYNDHYIIKKLKNFRIY